MIRKNPRRKIYKAVHLFAGIGGGALGFKHAQATIDGIDARIENVVGIDACAKACADYEMLTGSPSACIDLFTREQYLAFHTKWRRDGDEWIALKPAAVPEGWSEATPATIRDACRGIAPDIVFLSPPCKGLSSLLSGKIAESPKYRALNELVCRGLWLILEAFPESPPRMVLLENVPRIQVRGRDLIDRNVAMLNAYGFAVQETIHNCGTVGGLAQSRKRFLLVARHVKTVSPFLYEPPHQPMRPIADEILPLPLPFDPKAGPMHELSKRMHFKTWLRLALIPAGGDWRDLQEWAPGSFGVERTPFNNVYRVHRASEPATTVTAGGTPTSGGLSVADPRLTRDGFARFVVQDAEQTSRTVTGTVDIQSGALSAADPRLSDRPGRHLSKYRVDDPMAPSHTVTGARLGSGTISTTDPRLPPSEDRQSNAYRVSAPDLPSQTVVTSRAVGSGAVSSVDPRLALKNEKSVTLRMRGIEAPSPTVAASSTLWDSGGFSIVDPRPVGQYRNGTLGMGDLSAPSATVIASADPWTTGDNCAPDPRPTADWNEGVLGVNDPAAPIGTICGRSSPTNGAFSVAEERAVSPLPDFWPEGVPVLLSPHDGMMHRPLTPLELAALQGFPTAVNGEPLKLFGNSVSRWRDAIGNAVPPPAARAMAEQILLTLLGHDTRRPLLPTTGVWVQPNEWYQPEAAERLGLMEGGA